jgi:superfamily I DNA/RNA helicase
LELTAGQAAVVAHDARALGPCRVVGGFGSGLTTALEARAARLRSEGARPMLVGHPGMIGVAVEILRRHGRPVSLLIGDEQVAMAASLLDDRLRPLSAEVAAAMVAFQSSFLGDEELRVHADAAGMLEPAEELIALTARYLALLASRNRVDAGGALVSASLLLRDPAVLEAERARFDELLVDDFQLASFATNRLVSQLAGRGGALTVAGNPEAAVSSAPFSSPQYLLRFDRRFGAALDVTLEGTHRSPAVPTLRIVEDADEARQVALEATDAAAAMGIDAEGTAVVTRELAEAAVGRSWPLVVVPDATDGRWPSARPFERWFDTALLHGPDVPDDATRDRRWLDLERRRFRVATTRATQFLVVIAELPVTRFVGDLVG